MDKPISEVETKELNITIQKADDIEAFGAFVAGSVNDEKPTILLNMNAIISTVVSEGDVDAKEILISTLVHEFGHALEEFFNKEFDEGFIEKVTESYEQSHRLRREQDQVKGEV